MKLLPRRLSALIPALAAVFGCTLLQAQTVILSDPLQGSTSGTRSGGSFVGGGWRVDNQYDSIYWHVAHTDHGSFEYDVLGLGTLCPGGNGYIGELSHMYDHTFGNSDVAYDGGYRENPFKHFVRKQCNYKDGQLEVLWKVVSDYLENDSQALSWDSATSYHFKLEWQNAGGNATLKTFRNGELVLQEVLPGSYSPAGLSVRIAASPRRQDEGAPVGAVFSNVTVTDLSGGLNAPVISAPTAGERTPSPLVFIKWASQAHTQYQARISAADNAEAAIVWDSLTATSPLDYCWTAPLPNGSYKAFVRVGNAGGLSPWSAGRGFVVDTSFTPPGVDLVRVDGTSLRDHHGPFLGLGVTYMQALRRCKFDRPRFESDCALLASKGFNYHRALSMVGWDDLEIAPVTFTNSAGQVVQAWSDYDQQLKAMIDVAYTLGLRTELTIFADAQHVMPGDAARMTHLDRILAAIAGREHKLILLEVANEAWQNGFPGDEGVIDLRAKARYLADRTSVLVAISSPHNEGPSGLSTMYVGSAADIATYHFDRDLGTSEGGWLPVRDPWWSAHVPGVPPVSSNEPIGPGSSVASENDPIKLASAAYFAFLSNLPMYVYHTKAGVSGWANCCPPSGSEVRFEDSAGIDAYRQVRILLPPDGSSWVRNDGLEPTAPFTVYCNGQPNKYWPDVPGATSGCDRNIGGTKGEEFICYPMGILNGGLTLQARQPVSFTAYNPLTGEVVYHLALGANEQCVLPRGPGAYLLRGSRGSAGSKPAVDLGVADTGFCLGLQANGDGDTTALTVAGRDCRVNTDPAEDFYFYFGLCDSFAYQCSRPELWISFDYLDSGSGEISLQYDSCGGNTLSDFYKLGGSVPLGGTDTWKHATLHLSDAYFGNRQNGGADFRLGKVGGRLYIDKVWVASEEPLPPVIEGVPASAPVSQGVPYTTQLALTQGSEPVTWTVLQGPAGLQVSSSGMVSNWTPEVAELGEHTIEIQVINSEGVDTQSWTLLVLSRKDADADNDVDQDDFGFFQECLSGYDVTYRTGCAPADLSGDGDVDQDDLVLFKACLRGPDTQPDC